MDGVLVDSEPLWRRAEVQVFGEAGLALTEDECKATMGLRLDEVVRFRLPDRAPPERARIEATILDRVVALVSAEGEPKPGVAEAIAYVRSLALPMALASSSPLRLIHATLERIGLGQAFLFVHSAEHERWGKPHPAVYLTTAERLGVAPDRCVAIEDSLRGLLSAKAASMKCILIPEEPDPRFVLADVQLSSLAQLSSVAVRNL